MHKMSEITVEFMGYYKDTRRLANKSEMPLKEAERFIRSRVQPTLDTIKWTMQVKGDDKKSVENIGAALMYVAERTVK